MSLNFCGIMKLSELLEGFEIRNFREVEVTDLVYDSRRVTDGALFVAIKGEKADGHDFIPEAEKKGAVALIVEREVDTALPYVVVSDARFAMSLLADRFFGQPSRKLKVVGITGTNGKTTTSYMIHRIFEAAGLRGGLIGTVQYILPGREIPAVRTTPEAPDLHRMMVEIVNAGGTYVVMEVSSHSLVLHRVDHVDFDIAVFTNLTRDHLDYHKTIENYRNAKLLLFEKIVGSKSAVINADDPNAQYFIDVTLGRKILYGISHNADLMAKVIKSDMHGLDLHISGLYHGKLHLAMPGEHNAYNVLAALAVAFLFGIDFEKCAAALRTMRGVPGRFEAIAPSSLPFQVIIDYAHTPDALRNLLQSVRKLGPRRIITVFGAGGDRDRGKRPLMGQVVEQLSNYAVITNDNPRSEDPMAIIEDIKRGFSGTDYVVIPDREEAIYWAIGHAGPGDIVVIAGKGHENYIEIKGVRYPFSDKKVALEAIRKRLS